MKVAIIGCGVMGTALARHFSKKHVVVLCDHTLDKAKKLALELGGEAAATPAEAIAKTEMVILAFKPKDLNSFAQDNGKAFTKGQILVSILAGTSVNLLRKNFPAPVILRAMPNIALTCGEGVIGFVSTPEMTPDRRAEIEELFFGLGLLPWLSEEHLEALSALAGSGPAFIFVLIEALINGGVFLGFNTQEARDYVLQTVEGAVALLQSTGKSPAELIKQVASPGGTTMEGLKVLDESDVRGIIKNTLVATFNKARLLQK
jgi:pyrroline-5-carboxylate reductase